jgi:hypothetical protein
MAENPRTEIARDHDDKDVIEGMVPGGEAEPSTGGGALARDLSSREALGQVDDPDGKVRATKQDDIDAGQAYDSDRGPNRQ